MSLSLDKNDISGKIHKVSSLAELETLRVNYLGKKGLLTIEMKSMSSLSIDAKKKKGQQLNLVKTFIETELQIFIDLTFGNIGINILLFSSKSSNIDLLIPLLSDPKTYESSELKSQST